MRNEKKPSSHIIHKYVPAAFLVILFYFLINRFAGFLSIVKTILNILLKLVLAALAFFVVTFTIYMFNLDMKATALLAPFFEKWYDHLEHNQYI